MKQHITVEQARELNKEQFNKLYDWAENKYPEFFPHGVIMMLESSEKSLSRCIDIGRMIEFLDEKDFFHKINRYQNIGKVGLEIGDNKFVENWNVDGKKSFQKKELCDALWEAVKEVLEK